MPSPSVTFGFILATLYGALFHFLLGGDARRLAFFLLSAWLGFVLGHVFGVIFEVNVLNIGPLRTFSATLGSWLALIAARFLMDTQSPRRSD